MQGVVTQPGRGGEASQWVARQLAPEEAPSLLACGDERGGGISRKQGQGYLSRSGQSRLACGNWRVERAEGCSPGPGGRDVLVGGIP